MLALFVTIPNIYCLRKIRSLSADLKYSADHGPLPHIFAGQILRRHVRTIPGNMLVKFKVRFNRFGAISSVTA